MEGAQAGPGVRGADPGSTGIAVVIVSFQSADVLGACLESLACSAHPLARIVVCDNQSADGSADAVRQWANRHALALAEISPDAPLPGARAVLVHMGANRGYAGAVNAGLALLATDPAIGLFWVLNPDCMVLPETAGAFCRAAAEAPGFGLMGGRLCYIDPPGIIQSDGGQVSRWTGICRNVNQGLRAAVTAMPDPRTLDFISGASLVVSRAFLEQVGPMAEDYFLYYEEVDWAARRGSLPIRLAPGATTLHHGGTVIGSGAVNRRAQPFALWFNNRNRMRFVRRFRPGALPVAWAASMARAARLVLEGDLAGATAAFRGLLGLPPPAAVAKRLPEGFGRSR